MNLNKIDYNTPSEEGIMIAIHLPCMIAAGGMSFILFVEMCLLELTDYNIAILHSKRCPYVVEVFLRMPPQFTTRNQDQLVYDKSIS